MKTLNLVFNEEGFMRAPEDKEKKIQEISCIVIQNVVQSFAGQKGGFSQEDRNLWYKIEDALLKAIADKAETVELEDDEFGMLKRCFAGVRLQPNGLVRKLDELIAAVQNR